jgi:hypothetical protein
MHTTRFLTCLGGLLSATLLIPTAIAYSHADPFILESPLGYLSMSTVSRGYPVAAVVPLNAPAEAELAYINHEKSFLMIQYFPGVNEIYYPLHLVSYGVVGLGHAGYGPGTPGFSLDESDGSLVVNATGFQAFTYCADNGLGDNIVQLYWANTGADLGDGCQAISFKAVKPKTKKRAAVKPGKWSKKYF